MPKPNGLANEAQKDYIKSPLQDIEYLKEENKMKTFIIESLVNHINISNRYINNSNSSPNNNNTPNDSDYHYSNDSLLQ